MNETKEITVTSPRGLSTLKEYFPYANGLVYIKDGKKTTLFIKDNHLIIYLDVKDYEVNIASNGDSLTNDTLINNAFTKVTDAKREQIIRIRNIMFNGLPEVKFDKKDEIKIIDFGLSTFSQAATMFRTTLGKHYIGTFVYMAPELAIQKERATIHSDIWAVGCVVVEILTEKPIWGDLDDEDVKNRVQAGEITNLMEVPIGLRPILKDCFAFKASNRPTIFQLYLKITKNSQVN